MLSGLLRRRSSPMVLQPEKLQLAVLHRDPMPKILRCYFHVQEPETAPILLTVQIT